MKHIRPPKNFTRNKGDSDNWRSPCGSIVINWSIDNANVYVFTDWTGWELYDVEDYYAMKVLLESI